MKYCLKAKLIVQSPLQQGLKLLPYSFFRIFFFLLIVQSPLQQGLKPIYSGMVIDFNDAYRTKSITTRIETKTHKMNYIANIALIVQSPLQQGLKPEKFRQDILIG